MNERVNESGMGFGKEVGDVKVEWEIFHEARQRAGEGSHECCDWQGEGGSRGEREHTLCRGSDLGSGCRIQQVLGEGKVIFHYNGLANEGASQRRSRRQAEDDGCHREADKRLVGHRALDPSYAYRLESSSAFPSPRLPFPNEVSQRGLFAFPPIQHLVSCARSHVL